MPLALIDGMLVSACGDASKRLQGKVSRAPSGADTAVTAYAYGNHPTTTRRSGRSQCHRDKRTRAGAHPPPRRESLRRLAETLGVSYAELDEAAQPDDGAGNGVRLRVLGSLTVWRDGSPIAVGPPKQRALLGWLAISPGEVARVDSIIDALWGAKPPESAVNAVQGYVSRLRRLLAPAGPAAHRNGLLVAVPQGYHLRVDDDQLDLLAFRDRIAQARRARRRAEFTAAYDLYEQAMAWWRAEPLADVPLLRTHPAVRALATERVTAVLEFAAVAAHLRRHDLALPLLREITRVEPLHGAAHARLMIAIAGSGDQAAALRVFDEVRRRLADELGVDPDPELVDAHRQVLRQEIASGYAQIGRSRDRHETGRPAIPIGEGFSRPSPRPSAPAEPGGWGRVKEVTRLPTAPESRWVPHELPPVIGTFVGRRPDLADLERSLTVPRPHGPAVVVVDGGGGVGKSALAIATAHGLGDRFPDGQLYVDLQGSSEVLAPLSHLEVLNRLLLVLGADRRRAATSVWGAAAQFRSVTARRQILMVLDNAVDVAQLRPLIPGGSSCAVLVTSRRSLPALDNADHHHLDVLTEAEAVDLLGRHIGLDRVRAEPAEAVRIVRLCGRLPLAVRVAGARLAVRPNWTLRTLADLLSAEDGRLDELRVPELDVRASIAVSYRELKTQPDGDRSTRLFHHLGLWDWPDITPTIAAALCDVPTRDAEILLESLVDGALIESAAPGQYHMHGLVRLFAREQADRNITVRERRAALARVHRPLTLLARDGHRPAPTVPVSAFATAYAEYDIRAVSEGMQ
jgi:DNA-binding SARP family transcriptional activator